MNVILTGVTGTLGSQILLELIGKSEINTIFIYIRDKKNLSALQRFKRIIDSFILNNDKLKVSTFDKKIRILNTEEFFNPNEYLLDKNQNYFIHSAGYVNLSTKDSDRETILNENFNFSKQIFDRFNSYIKKFTYISTAFSIGDIGGEIHNDYHKNITPNYRNAYEESKHKTEKYLIDATKQKDIKLQILRPSVIGGNINTTPKSYISKFMVYYLIGKFFYNNPLLADNKIRLSTNFKAGLNIIPVDYVAKVVAKVFKDDNVFQLNIVNKKCTDFVSGFSKIIKTVGFKQFSFLDGIKTEDIKEMNTLERFYYSSIGEHLSPYTLSTPYEFNTDKLESILPIPIYDLELYLEETIKFAMNNNFRNEKW